jgi:hypothetical protein
MLIRIYLLPKQKETTDKMVAFLRKLLGLIKTRALEKAKSEEEISNIRKYVEKTESLYSRFKQDIFNMEGFPDTVPEDHTNYMEYYTQNDHGIKHIYKNKTVAIEESNQDKAHSVLRSDDNNDGHPRIAVNNTTKQNNAMSNRQRCGYDKKRVAIRMDSKKVNLDDLQAEMKQIFMQYMEASKKYSDEYETVTTMR